MFYETQPSLWQSQGALPAAAFHRVCIETDIHFHLTDVETARVCLSVCCVTIDQTVQINKMRTAVRICVTA